MPGTLPAAAKARYHLPVRRDLVLASLLALSAAALTGGVTWVYFDWQSSGRAMPGATVGGELQPTDVSLGDWLEARQVRLLDREAYFLLPDSGGTLPVSFGELGVGLDVAATMKVASAAV